MTTNSTKLDRSFSLYLDLVRFLAAVLVVLTHYVQQGIVTGALAAATPMLGREAVMVFFVLSGFVIAYTTEQKQHSAREYLLSRCARIYSVALPVAILAFLGAGIAHYVFNVELSRSYQLDRAYVYLPFHLLFGGEIWSISEVPPWLGPYWSLGFEVWYYVLFGTLYYLKGATRLLAAGTLFLFVGYKLWLLFPVWMSGVYLYHWQKSRTLAMPWARFGWCVTLLLLAAYKLSGADIYLRSLGQQIWPFPALRLLNADRFLADYVTCAIICANFLFARFARFEQLIAAATPIRLFASHTFTLYLVHGVVMGAWLAFYRHDARSAADIALLTLAIGISTWLLGFVTERRKDLYYRLFDKATSAILGKQCAG